MKDALFKYDAPDYIVKLIGKVITVSLETQKAFTNIAVN